MTVASRLSAKDVGSGQEDGASVQDPQQTFAAFFELTYRPLSRLAFLLTADHAAADDLTGDTMLAIWRQWDRIQEVDNVQAYVRRMMANMAATRVRRTVRERTWLVRMGPPDTVTQSDPVVTTTMQWALAALPEGRRACVVLRYGFDLPETEVAEMLGVSVGTVKSQTSKAVKQLTAVLGEEWPGGSRR